MPPPSVAVRAALPAEVEASSPLANGAMLAFARVAEADLERYLESHREILGKAAQPGLAKRIAILAAHIAHDRGLDLEAGIRLSAAALRARQNPSTLRKCASEARALAAQLQRVAKGSASVPELVAAASGLSVDRLVRRRADELLGSKGGRPARRGAAVEAVVRAIYRARQGDPAAAGELQMIRQILGAHA